MYSIGGIDPFVLVNSFPSLLCGDSMPKVCYCKFQFNKFTRVNSKTRVALGFFGSQDFFGAFGFLLTTTSSSFGHLSPADITIQDLFSGFLVPNPCLCSIWTSGLKHTLRSGLDLETVSALSVAADCRVMPTISCTFC